VGDSSAPGTGGSGPGTFVAFYACFAFVAFFVLPLSAFRSLAREREEHTWALLVLTRMGPRQILAGKIGSYLAQAVLYGCVMAPFLLFSYLLQGIALVTVLMAIVAGLDWQVFLTVLAVTAATLAESRFWRGLMSFLVMGALGTGTMTAIGIVGTMAYDMSLDSEALVGIGLATWLMLAYGAIFFAIAVSRLSPESHNRALLPRLALLGHMLGTAGVTALLALAMRGRGLDVDDFGIALATAGALHSYVAGIFLATGPAGMPRGMRGRLSGLSRFGLLQPGAASGFLTFVLLIVGFVAAGLAVYRGTDLEFFYGATAIACLTLIYVSVPAALGRGPLARWLAPPAYLRIFTVVFGAIGMGLPPLVSIAIGGEPDNEALNFFNPAFAIKNASRVPETLWVLVPVTIAATLLALTVLCRRDREANKS
jgi:hypothetical protein